MHLCTCGNRDLVIQMVPPGEELGSVFCENFKACPEEQRTGVRNDQWLEFLQEGRTQRSLSPAVPWPLTSGLIELKGVQAEVEKRRASQVLPSASVPQLAVPPVLMPARDERPASSRHWGLGALAVLFAAGMLGVHAYHETRADGGAGGQGALAHSPAATPPASSPSASSPSASTTPTPAAPAPVLVAAAAPAQASAPVQTSAAPQGASFGAPGSLPAAGGAEPSPSGPAVIPVDREDADRAEEPRGRSSSRRDADRRRARRERRGHEALRSADRVPAEDRLAKSAAAPGADTQSLHAALAKAAAASPSSPQVLPSFGAQASGAPTPGLSSPGLHGAKGAAPKPVVSGVDRLLSQAAVAAPLETSGIAVPRVPERLGGAALGRLSLKVAAKVRQCAQQYGFARTMVVAQLQVSGASGRITSVSLSDRFAGSPVESCSRGRLGSVTTPTFSADSQKLSVPVVVH